MKGKNLQHFNYRKDSEKKTKFITEVSFALEKSYSQNFLFSQEKKV